LAKVSNWLIINFY